METDASCSSPTHGQGSNAIGSLLVGFSLYTWSEQYFGDITGIEKLLGPDPSKAKKK